MDKKLTESLKGKVHHTSEIIKDHLVICGGTLSRVVKAFDDDDSILACKAIHDLILHPQNLFSMSGIRSHTLSQCILSNADATFATFDSFLEEQLIVSSGIHD